MKKNRTKKTRAEARFASGRSASTTESRVPKLLLEGRQALRELVLANGLKVFAEMLEEDRTLICGPRHQPNAGRSAYRHGHDEGQLVFGGRKIRLQKPRVRSVAGEEMELPTWREMADEDPLHHRIVEQILLGVSSRGYEGSLEPVPEEIPTAGTRRSSVSRRFTARTAEQARAFLSRPLDALDLPVVLVDGTGLGDHVLLVALGIDGSGKKHVLGVSIGTTENEQVCRSLFRNLIERGLVTERARLFVIDGGKGIRKAIRSTFGSWAVIQRCQIHKLRNVAEYLPKHGQAWVKADFRGWVDLPDSLEKYKVSPYNFKVDRTRVRKLVEDTMTALEGDVDFSRYQHILIVPGVNTTPGKGYGMICYCANPGMLTGVKGKLAFTTVRSRAGKEFDGGVFVGAENAHLGMYAHDFFHALGGIEQGRRLAP